MSCSVSHVQCIHIYTVTGYERVYLLLYKVADTPFHIQGDDLSTPHINRGIMWCNKVYYARRDWHYICINGLDLVSGQLRREGHYKDCAQGRELEEFDLDNIHLDQS